MTSDRVKALTRLADLPGLFLGIQILSKGVEKLHYFRDHPFLVSFFFAAGGFIVVGSVAHHFLEKRIRNVHALFHLLEGAALALSALLLFEKGRLRMPLVLLFLGIIYVVVGAVGFRMNPGNVKRVGRQLLKWVGLAFIAAGLTAIALNLRHDRNPWVFAIGGLFLVIGLVYVVCCDWLVNRLGRIEPVRPNEIRSDGGPGTGRGG